MKSKKSNEKLASQTLTNSVRDMPIYTFSQLVKNEEPQQESAADGSPRTLETKRMDQSKFTPINTDYINIESSTARGAEGK